MYETLSKWHDQENKSEAMVELAENPRALLNALKNRDEAKSSVPALLAAGARVDIVDQVLSHGNTHLCVPSLLSFLR